MQPEYRSNVWSDLSLMRRSAPEVEHKSALRVCVDLVSLNVCQHCSCTSVHILCTPADVVTSALAQVFSKTVIHGIESQHSFNCDGTDGIPVSFGKVLSACACVCCHSDVLVCDCKNMLRLWQSPLECGQGEIFDEEAEEAQAAEAAEIEAAEVETAEVEPAQAVVAEARFEYPAPELDDEERPRDQGRLDAEEVHDEDEGTNEKLVSLAGANEAGVNAHNARKEQLSTKVFFSW